MTLGCDTAAVLMSALDLLRHQTTPAQHALLTPDERRSSLHQLTVAVEAAAKLAEVAYVEAVAVAGRHNAAGVDADRIRAEAERFKAEAEKVMAETERTRAEAEKSRSETERKTAAIAPAAACTKPLETPGVTPSHAIAPQTTPGSSSSPPDSASPPGSETTVIGLCVSHIKVTHIMDELAEWNRNNTERYTPAGWAWFRHSETEAFVLLHLLGDGELSVVKDIGNRTGTIEIPSPVGNFLNTQSGYGGFIYGRKRENGKRDSVLIL